LSETVGTFFPVGLRFKLFFALLLAVVGVFFSYLALYLKTVGLSGSQIGIILGMIPLISFLVQPVWGMLSDIYRLRRSALVCACFGVAIPAWLYNAGNDFWWLFGLTLVLAMMNGPIGPLGDALALEYLEHQGRREDYGSLRLWGAIGFAVSTFLIGALVAEAAIRLIIPIYSLMMAALGLLALTLPDAAPTRIVGWLEGAALLRRAPQLAKFLVSMLLSCIRRCCTELGRALGCFWLASSISMVGSFPCGGPPRSWEWWACCSWPGRRGRLR
jgi:MFS transporter, PPP family, 3-phenylpropionic acid transporter